MCVAGGLPRSLSLYAPPVCLSHPPAPHRSKTVDMVTDLVLVSEALVGEALVGDQASGEAGERAPAGRTTGEGHANRNGPHCDEELGSPDGQEDACDSQSDQLPREGKADSNGSNDSNKGEPADDGIKCQEEKPEAAAKEAKGRRAGRAGRAGRCCVGLDLALDAITPCPPTPNGSLSPSPCVLDLYEKEDLPEPGWV